MRHGTFIYEEKSLWPPPHSYTLIDLPKIPTQLRLGKHEDFGNGLGSSVKPTSNSDVDTHRFIDESMDLDNHDDCNAIS